MRTKKISNTKPLTAWIGIYLLCFLVGIGGSRVAGSRHPPGSWQAMKDSIEHDTGNLGTISPPTWTHDTIFFRHLHPIRLRLGRPIPDTGDINLFTDGLEYPGLDSTMLRLHWRIGNLDSFIKHLNH